MVLLTPERARRRPIVYMRIPRINVLGAELRDSAPGSDQEVPCHEYFEMIYFLWGEGRVKLESETAPVAAGAVALIKPNRRPGLQVSGTCRTLRVSFIVARSSLRRRLLAGAAYLPAGDPGMAAIFERIHHECQRQGPLYHELCNTYMAELVLTFLRKQKEHSLNGLPVAGDGKPLDDLLDNALEYINKRYNDSISISDITREVGCSDRALRRHFQTALGMGPLEYLQRHRVERAKALMEDSHEALKQIAGAVGFRSIHHFTRRFSAIVGTPPAAWRAGKRMSGASLRLGRYY